MRFSFPNCSLLLLFSTTLTVQCKETPIFPGPWERYIQAPETRDVRPVGVYYKEGIIDTTFKENITLLRGQGALVTFEFAQNIAGRLFLESDSSLTSPNQSIGIAFTESPLHIGRKTDGTGDRIEHDLSHFLPLVVNGTTSISPDHTRGAFKYLTLFIPSPSDPKDGQASPAPPPPSKKRSACSNGLLNLAFTLGAQNNLVPKDTVALKDIWIEYTAFPSYEDLRRYTGYFYSNDNLLNRIWYAGAYTLQLTTVPPKQGGSLIDYNRNVDGNKSPPGSWYSNFTISNGSSVTTDGAKRDRMVYAGDMTIAVPGIAVSTYDLVSVKNALDTLFEHYYHSSPEEGGADSGRIRLPYAGPPMGSMGEFSDTYHLHALLGVYQYVLFSGDLRYLKKIWERYVMALQYSLDKVVSGTGLMYVTSGSDWLRPGMGKENIEAQGILFKTLLGSAKLAEWLKNDGYEYTDIDGLNLGNLVVKYNNYSKGIQAGVVKPGRLWDETKGLFSDNPKDRRNIFPQDGNSWAVATGMVSRDIGLKICESLKSRWGTYGAPAVEIPNTISPFASGFELQAHASIGNITNVLELLRLQWGYMLDGPGFTNSTFIEGFSTSGDIKYPAYTFTTRNSHAHGWSAGPTSVLTDSVLGIKLTTPMGRTWSISPQPGDLTNVEGGFETGLGKFVVVYSMSGTGEEALEIETPEGTSGVVGWLGDAVSIEGGKWKWSRVGGQVTGGRL